MAGLGIAGALGGQAQRPQAGRVRDWWRDATFGLVPADAQGEIRRSVALEDL